MNVNLINSNGVQIGVVSFDEAKRIALTNQLELVVINANANPPVYKIVDLEKYNYQRSKQEKEQRRKQKKNEIKTKELRFSINIQEHDLLHKVKQIVNFISNNSRVKLTVQLRGRELQKKHVGYEVLYKLLDNISRLSEITYSDFTESNNMICTTLQKKV